MRQSVKNLKFLVEKEAIQNHVYSLWQSEAFKKSHLELDGHINKLVKKFSEFPRFFADMSDPSIEKSQFYSYFNILMYRTYHNKVIQDLYYLHEIMHMTTMPYDSKMSFNEWLEKMIANEMEASIESEVLIYKHLPIRGQSFNFEIWYDSLKPEQLENKANLKKFRLERMINPQTDVEIVLNKYHNNNQIWGQIWKKNFVKVEKALEKFKKKSLISKDDAVKELMTFFDENATDNVLFKLEAKQFSKVYSQI